MQSRVIDGRFELVARLGGGGMGTVWRAWDQALHREVALKEVRPPDDQDSAGARELRLRVLREARALARLNHPHVVTIHHIVDEGESGYPWLVMELVTGGSLQDRLQHGPLTIAETVRLGREVLSALRAAHAVGIQHRDVKPANVLLRPDGTSVLTDFGIAAVRESTSLTATGSFIGSPEYISPERINGFEGDPASDLWSLGMLLYVAVEGNHPLRRSTTLATLAAVLNQEVPPPLRAGPLGPVLAALLRRDPNARPDADTLDRMLASVDTSFVPSPPPMVWNQPPPQVMTMPSRRRGHGARNAVIAVSLAALAVVGVIGWSQLPPGTMGGPQAQASTPSASKASPSKSPVKETRAEETDEPTQADDLLTPAGMRAMIAKLKPVIGGTKVTRLVVYPEYASIDAPVKGEKGVYDRFSFRNGVAKRDGIGGPARETPVDLESFNWDALPALIKKAEKDLGVRKPTTRYLVLDRSFAFVVNGRTGLMVYVSDKYHRTGYLVADVKGKVIRMSPAS